MTHEEAREKWCPFARIGGGTNRVIAAPDASSHAQQGTYCIGTRCMAWRWDLVPNPDYNALIVSFPIGSTPSHIHSETDGHCGLAHG